MQVSGYRSVKHEILAGVRNLSGEYRWGGGGHWDL